MSECVEHPVLAFDIYESNAHLIAVQVRLGNLRPEWRTLDVTYGYGNFWKVWKPDWLVGCDINPEKSPIGRAIDFRYLPFSNRSFDVVVFDPPYRFNGTPDREMDEAFGIDQYTRWQDRMRMIRDGARACARVADKMLLVKCQDQVVSSKIRWQTRAVCDEVEPLGFGLKHRFDYAGSRPQPEGRDQRNPYSCSSQLLVFQRGWKWSDLDG